MKKIIALTLFTFVSLLHAQENGKITGTVRSKTTTVSYVNIFISSLKKATVTNAEGKYSFNKIPFGTYEIQVSGLGFQTVKKSITINNIEPQEVNFDLTDFQNDLNEVVVTGTKTFKRKTESQLSQN